jgi:hypothetical protein
LGFRDGIRLQPEPASNDRRVDAGIFPPANFIAAAVHLAMMSRHNGTVNSSLTLRPSA